MRGGIIRRVRFFEAKRHSALRIAVLFAAWTVIPVALFGQAPEPLQGWTAAKAPALHISRETDPWRPFSVVGPRGALLGEQNGVCEAWIFPWKIFSDLRISAQMQDLPEQVDVNAHAAEIDVTPEATTITYSHANFTVRQIMFAPKEGPEGVGAVMLFQVEAVQPITLTISFLPAMQRMWPAASDPQPDEDWVKTPDGSEFYVLSEDVPGEAAALAMPTAEPGILPAVRDGAQPEPLEFVLHYDPARDANKVYPLLMTLGNSPQTTTQEALARSLAAQDAGIPALYESNAAYYEKLLATHTSIATPDKKLNEAFSWAIAAIDQLRVDTPEGQGQAFTAGMRDSGNTVRPGFGWFFGRDSLWTLYAVDSYGDWQSAREEFEFLIRHQRPDGKIMHEYSQTANLVDWQSLPYEYAAADSTPLFLMAANDYLKTSGDADFIRAHWDALALAWNFETSHVSDDGIYNNSQGTGWVESWIPAMPQQEIYLAALDQQASTAFSELARATGHAQLSDQAAARAARIGKTIEKAYYLPDGSFYAFSRNANGSTDGTPTIFPAVAWWDGSYSLEHTDAMMRRWASSEFSTDWGTRLLSDKVSFYDPTSYHQGSVWPLFTGWVSLAEYRAGHPLAGYAHLMQNADLTWAEDPGSVTELLSGQFFQTFSFSTAHQLWSSAMVISPVLRGMFGLGWNAAGETLTVNPRLPAAWSSAQVLRAPLGLSTVDLAFTRREGELVVSATSTAAVHLASEMPGARVEGQTLMVPLPAVEAWAPEHLPEFGAETAQMKILDEERGGRSLTLTLSAEGSSEQTVYLRENAPGLHLRAVQGTLGAPDAQRDRLIPWTVAFPAGSGEVTQKVTVSW